MFVKLGQLLSTRADLVPPSVVAELSRLQDQVTPAPQEEIDKLLEAELGRPVAEAFSEFDPEPIAAASIGQAYRARLRTGEEVVVKVQRPGIAESVERDLLVLTELARTVEARTSWGAEYHVTELAGEFAERLREELDSARRPATPPRLPPAWPATTRSMSRSSTGSCRPHGSWSWIGWTAPVCARATRSKTWGSTGPDWPTRCCVAR